MNGSDFEPSSPAEHGIGSQQLVFEYLESFNAWNEGSHGFGGRLPPVYHDVAELCGGAGDTGSLLIRRGNVKGPNFDIVVGFNLLKESMCRAFLRYLARAKPTVLIISTPCTGMKGFSALNRAIDRSAWLRSRQTSVPLAKLGALAAYIQVREGRHFIA